MTNKVKNATESATNEAVAALADLTNVKSFKEMETIMTKNTAQFEKLAQDAQKAGQENLDALVEAGNIFTKGFESLVKKSMALAQSGAEKNAEAVKALLSCKTLNEYAETQSKLAQENLDSFLSNVTALSEISVKLAQETLEPINDQFSKTVKKTGSKAA